MTDPFLSVANAGSPLADSQVRPAQKVDAANSDIGLRFEKMLWAEMLMHAGLEEALTLNGGEAASSFSRYVVEAIAEDIAEKHPLGLSTEISTLGRGTK